MSKLEEQIRRAQDCLADLDREASRTGLNATHPGIRDRLAQLHATLYCEISEIHWTDRGCEVQPRIKETAPAAHGRASAEISTVASSNKKDTPNQNTIERPRVNSSEMTFSFQEPGFSRRLQRYCLEYAFRLFLDPRSPPTTTYRVFRLVACVQDKGKTYPRFRELVTGGIQDPLELPSLPFYCVGGAGTHYPLRDALGDPVYPSNMRLPNRILGCMSFPDGQSNNTGLDRQKLLELFGLDGQWFDCRDVEEYLRSRGVCIEQSSVLPRVSLASQDDELSSHDSTDTRALDVESFFKGEDALDRDSISPADSIPELRNGVVLLGRAPGFRKTDVQRAFESSLRVLVSA